MSNFILALLAALARALLAHGCGEALHLLLEYFVPGIPPLACGAVGLVVGITLVEIVLVLWHRRRGEGHRP